MSFCDQVLQNWNMGGSNLWIQQTTINGSMIGYDRPLNFFTFFDLRHVQGTREWGGGVGADQSWTKKANFGSVQFDLKLKILKDYSNRFFFCKFTISGENFSKFKP